MIETRNDLLSVMATSIGDGIDLESYFDEMVEEECRLNGGHYGQVGKGFHVKPFVRVDELPCEAGLAHESKRERRIRLFVGSIADTSAIKAMFTSRMPKIKMDQIVALLPKPPIFISSIEEAKQLPEGQLKILKTSVGAAVCL